ncbi:unnamed protein product [Cuscuta epithymum]|uniref:SWIM-type domain-containing protein n=1 Tax=Cuscuta epithymum TaxID=186058 RepID=A0AAV0EPR6_9ASTE|nr:unnamed protein product [Cuscuta epithymum]
MIFTNVAAGVQFYKQYATLCGFDIRKSTSRKSSDGACVWKYILCNREGFKNLPKPSNIESSSCVGDGTESMNTESSSSNSENVAGCNEEVKSSEPKGIPSNKRRRVSNRVGCRARLVMRLHAGHGYLVTRFEERHKHPMTSTPSRPFLKVNRALDAGHQNFVLNCSKANIGTMKCYRLYKETVGGYSNIGATAVDFKNFKRDLKAYVSGVDAQMLVDKLFRKRETCSEFFFAYDVDASDQLTRIFWADPVCRKNYALFGDVVSFDATFETNRYNMVFAPFTGVDNHKKCITFAAGLISKEDIESYEWIFRSFISAMTKEPTCIITDQDPAIRAAIENVFTVSRHRYCMWHIMSKLTAKVGPTLSQDTEFLTKINSVVWNNHLQVESFERKWMSVMEEYDLLSHKWFSHMFDIRKFWIPAYFRDLFMAGMLRTTSRSESENNFFNEFTNPHFSLVEFFMQFDSAMDSQRHIYAQLNSVSESSIPVYNTPLGIERFCSSIYNLSVFYEVQQEISAACFSCRVLRVETVGDVLQYSISDERGLVFDVVHNVSSDSASCSCKYFERFGLLCRHIFVVLKDLKFETLPSQFVLPRWCKSSVIRSKSKVGDILDDQCASMEKDKHQVKHLWSDIYFCVGFVEHHPDLFKEFADHIKLQKDKFMSLEASSGSSSTKNDIISSFYGSSIPSEVNVHPPEIARNKGCGKRIKGGKEKSIEASKKSKRLCRTCNELAFHDSRNCPLNS